LRFVTKHLQKPFLACFLADDRQLWAMPEKNRNPASHIFCPNNCHLDVQVVIVLAGHCKRNCFATIMIACPHFLGHVSAQMRTNMVQQGTFLLGSWCLSTLVAMWPPAA
jgi:hypothetical protein